MTLQQRPATGDMVAYEVAQASNATGWMGSRCVTLQFVRGETLHTRILVDCATDTIEGAAELSDPGVQQGQKSI